jgi:hypothetical protein
MKITDVLDMLQYEKFTQDYEKEYLNMQKENNENR